MQWQKIEDSCYNEWALVDSFNEQLIVIGWQMECGQKLYKIYTRKPLGFLFSAYTRYIDIRDMKNFVEKTIRNWMLEQLGSIS